jgi:hypothetical protein
MPLSRAARWIHKEIGSSVLRVDRYNKQTKHQEKTQMYSFDLFIEKHIDTYDKLLNESSHRLIMMPCGKVLGQFVIN